MEVVGFVAERVVQRSLRFGLRCHAVVVVIVIPTEFSSTIRTVQELFFSCVEVIAALIGNDEFDGCGATNLHHHT